jgi:hypothetical protein
MLYCYLFVQLLFVQYFFVSFINCTVLVSMLCGSVRTKGIQVPSTYVRMY